MPSVILLLSAVCMGEDKIQWRDFDSGMRASKESNKNAVLYFGADW